MIDTKGNMIIFSVKKWIPWSKTVLFKKNMPMKDTIYNRRAGFGIYSLHTIFYAKIINTQWNKAVFIL